MSGRSPAISAWAARAVEDGTIDAFLGLEDNIRWDETRLAASNAELVKRWIAYKPLAQPLQVDVAYSFWFNPDMNYKTFMVPGIMVMLVTMIGMFLASMNIVREKEIGTIEQINVTPIRKHIFILGKLIPFWIMGQIVLTLGLLIARIVYGIIPAGNPLLLYLFSSVYMLAVLGLGLLVSTYAQTQQQAMLIAFFLMMVFILLGGLYTSIDSMPAWARMVTKFNPVAYFIEVMRMVVLKGSGLRDIAPALFRMCGFSVLLNAWAVLSYRKRS